MKRFIFLMFFPVLLLAQQENMTPEEIQAQLNADEKEFLKAKEMFNPWYAGPLLTGGAHMMPPGYIGLQPYVFINDFHSVYDRHWHSINTPDLIQVNPSMNAIQAGVTDWLDASLAFQGLFNWRDGAYSDGWGDTSLGIGFPLLKEGVYTPAMKIGFTETFPTGRYNDLNPRKLGTDATGAGSYQTAFSFRIAKLTLWNTRHPLNLRATYTYTIPTSVKVKNFNAYGGGEGTKGKVRPGNQSNVSVGIEWSFTQNWVFCNDFVYVHNDRAKFSGTRGTLEGAPAIVGVPSNEQFSLAPGIEYNPTPDLNFLAGVWFTVAGRNSSNFVSGIISMAYTFKVPSKK